MLRTWLIGLFIVCMSSASLAETIILQAGPNDPAWTARTIWPKPPKDKPSDDALHFRGSQNRLLLKIDLPAAMKGRKLARARLELFAPKVDKLRMICEIACRDANPAADPPGVLDSCSLWEYAGQYFPHRYAFLGVPDGGKWIDFNITPAVEKWQADPAANHGIVLEGLALGDKRFPNTASIDFPSPTSPDTQHRPRLVLEFEPLDRPYLVGMTHALQRYGDRDTRYRFFGPFEETYELSMARNEYEPFQVLVCPIAGPMKNVRFDWTDLADASTGATIPKADIAYNVQEIVTLHANGKVKDWYFHGKGFDLPDPLSTARPVDLPRHLSTPFWFTVRTRPATKPGTYTGTITVLADNAPPRPLRLTVRVWNHALPEKWTFQTMGQTCWEYIWKTHTNLSKDQRAAMKRKYIDFLLDHRFTPTEQYADRLSPDIEDIPYCFERGANTIYLSGNFTGNVQSLKQRYEQVKQLGLIDHALVYIGDETSKWDQMRQRSDAIRRACPELMIMIGGSFPRPELDGIIDIFDPQIDLKTNKVYSLPADQMRPLIAQSQSKGERFFWYVAAGPMLPCPNVQLEDPLIASRVLFWMTWKFGVTGFEYYCYNIWTHNLPGKDGKRWPDKPFSPRGWGDTNGDGMLFYPGPDGPFSSVRFENIRDGIEDWEMHALLRDAAEALRLKHEGRPMPADIRALLDAATAVLAVPDEVCELNFAKWTWDPQVLLKARQNLGQTLDAVTRQVSEAETAAVRTSRQDGQLARQRAMLKARSDSAGR